MSDIFFDFDQRKLYRSESALRLVDQRVLNEPIQPVNNVPAARRRFAADTRPGPQAGMHPITPYIMENLFSFAILGMFYTSRSADNDEANDSQNIDEVASTHEQEAVHQDTYSYYSRFGFWSGLTILVGAASPALVNCLGGPS